MHVLLDGGYRQEAEGTGISMYARTLAAALGAMGHRVQWLSGANAPAKGDELALAASVSERATPLPAHRRYAQTLLRITQGILGGAWTARAISSYGLVVSDGDDIAASDTLVAANLFVKAHYRHMLLGAFSTLKVPVGVDVLHLTAPLPVKLPGVPTVVTIHDLVPARLPYTTPDNRAEYVRRLRTSVANSDLVVTVSEASKRDIVEFLKVDPAKVVVTYQSSDLVPLSPDERPHVGRALSKFGLAADGYCLFVGALEPKKNLRRLIEAFLETEGDGPLVVVGRRAWMWERDEAWLATLDPKARERLKFLDYVARDDLRWLYAGAQMLVFPSLYEGFGLPLLEAMTAGCPVITSRVASMPEVCGEAAVYVDPLKRDEIRAAIERLRADPQLRRDLASKGLVRAQKFSFEAYIERLRDAYALLPPRAASSDDKRWR